MIWVGLVWFLSRITNFLCDYTGDFNDMASPTWPWLWKPCKLDYRRSRTLRCWYTGARACIATWHRPSCSHCLPVSVPLPSCQLLRYRYLLLQEMISVLFFIHLPSHNWYSLCSGSSELYFGPSYIINKAFLIS